MLDEHVPIGIVNKPYGVFGRAGWYVVLESRNYAVEESQSKEYELLKDD